MWYEITTYKKNVFGKWVEHKTKLDHFNMPYGVWKRTQQLDRKNGDKTYLETKVANGGLNINVTRATTYFCDGKEKVVYKLITTANKIPAKYYQNKRKSYNQHF